MYLTAYLTSERRAGFGRHRLAAALMGLLVATGHSGAEVCMLFSPTRQDIPGLLEPVIVLSGDLDEQGTPDLVVIDEEIPGDITQGAAIVFLATGTGSYVATAPRIISGSPQSAVLGYFNADSHLDLAVAHFLSSSVSILLGTGSGSLAPPLVLALPSTPTALAAAELTGDGLADLIVITSPTGFEGTARVYRGLGNGTFTPHSTALVDKDPRGVVVAQLNNDTILDLAVANRLGQSLTLIPGTGGGLLGSPTSIALGASAQSIAAVDLNNDLKLDLVVSSDTVGMSVIPLIGDGLGGFSPGSPVNLASEVPSIAICDYDKDGNRDVMAAKFTADSVSLLRGTGNGTFAPPTDLGANARPRWVHSSDINNDGFCDTVSANQVAGSLSLFLGDGLGNVGTPSFTAGLTPLSVATGDLDGDWFPDVVSADRDSNSVSILLGDGEGRMTLSSALGAGVSPGSVVIQDLSGDGLPDIAVANQGPPGAQQVSTVSVFFGNGLGAFPTMTSLSAGRLPLDVISEDFNGDGLFDLAIANGNSDNVSVFLSQGGGAFGSRKNSRTGAQPRSLAALHVNGDGILDLAVSQGLDNSINILLGAGNGTFSELGSVLPGGGLNVDDLIAADLNGDGWKDLAWIDQQSINQPASVSVFLSDGAGWFVEAPTSDLPTGTFAESLVAIDMDRMGGLDLAVVNRFDDTAQVYFGSGTGTFSNGGVFGVGHQPFSAAIADFNRDGRQDLVTADFDGDSISILLNNTYIDTNFSSMRATSTASFSWDPFPGATSYRVYRGDSSLLRQRDYGNCFASVTSPGFTDMELPSPGKVFVYLAAAIVNGEEGTLGMTTSCLKRVNRHPCSAP